MQAISKIHLIISIIKQGKRYVAYSPALDLSTSGKTELEAKNRFEEAADIFLEELTEAGTLSEVLKELGWYKARTNWQPPKLVSQKSVDLLVPATR